MNLNSLCCFASSILFATSRLLAGEDFAVSGIPDESPIAVTAIASATELVVDISLEPEWHVFSRDVGSGQPMMLSTDSGSAIVATGPVQLPRSETGKLTGAIQLRLPVGLGQAGNAANLDVTLKVQVCDALECLPPMEIKISGKLPPLNVLLVVGARDERTTRIADWLKSRGFDTTITTYANVEMRDCDGSDVVLADSQIFGKTSASRVDVRKFPISETPLVAVGFNGTELIESHKIAMTSGYI